MPEISDDIYFGGAVKHVVSSIIFNACVLIIY